MLRKIYVLLFCITVCTTHAQVIHPDSIYTVEDVIVSSNRLTRYTTGSKVVELDSAVLRDKNNNTLADLLATQTQVFVKSYGIAGLSTPSFRGMNASQTAILWNGFNISSPMNGGQDLALLPVNFVNTIKLQYGGSGALWGSGAIGGTVHLINTPEFDKGFTAGTSLSMGSFGDQQQNIEIGISKKRFISTTKFFHHQATNNFTYQNLAQFNKPEQRMKNAEFNQNGILQENYIKLNKTQNLSFRFWYQNNNRNLPASMTTAQSKASQQDEVIRSTLEWQRLKDKTAYFVRAAYFDETLNYTDPLISLTSNSQSKTFISEAETKIKVSAQQLLNIGINNTYNTALTKNYTFTPTQNRTSFFGSYQLRNKKSTLKTTLSARQEFISNGNNPFTASVGAEAWFFKNFRLRGIVSKNYRIPTFNDLYWAQGGNPDLLPEEGWSEEVGLAYFICKSKFSLEYEITGLTSQVSNWIMWTPNNAGIWSPENIAEVISQGFENELKIKGTVRKVYIDMGIQYQHIQTTYEKNNASDQSIGKQLIYTPVDKALISLSLEYHRIRIGATYNYVGYRNTTSDNTQFLDPYQLINLTMSKTVALPTLLIKVYLQLNNIMQEAYQNIAYYATPLQSYQLGLIVNFNKPNKK